MKKSFKVLSSTIIGIIFLATLVCGAHLIFTSTGASDFGTVNENETHLYNFSINNTDNTMGNITQVNITLPNAENFSFTSGSNGTDAGVHNFTNTTDTLSWTNTTSLVVNSTTNYFWFNVTATWPGTYNFNVTIANSSGYVNSTNLSVNITDTTDPTISYNGNGTETDGANLSVRYISVNVTANDTYSMDTINISLYNSSHELINSSTGTSSPFDVNFTVDADGVYYFNATVNDTAGNTANTSTRTITIDNVAPVINLTLPADSTSNTTDAYNFTFTVNDTYSVESCELVLNSTIYQTITTITNPGVNVMENSSIPVGTYVWYVNCTDYAGNEGNSSTRTLNVTAATTPDTTTTTTTTSSSSNDGYNPTSSSDGETTLVYGGMDLTIEYDNTDYILDMDAMIYETSVGFTIEGTEYSMEEGDYIEIDLDGDGNNDISIKVEDIRSPYADLLIKEITTTTYVEPAAEDEVIAPVVEDEPTPDSIEEPAKSYAWVWILFGVLTILAIVIFAYSKKDN